MNNRGTGERGGVSGGGSGRVAAVALALVILVAVAVVAGPRPQAQEEPAWALYKDTKQPVEKRVKDLLGRMTVEEKVSLLSGANWMETVAIPRLGIPSIKMADGPAGIRSWLRPFGADQCGEFEISEIHEHGFSVGNRGGGDLGSGDGAGGRAGAGAGSAGDWARHDSGADGEYSAGAAVGQKFRRISEKIRIWRRASAWATSRACRAKA